MTNTDLNANTSPIEAARILCDCRNDTESRVHALSILDGNPTDQTTLDWYAYLQSDEGELDHVARELWDDGEFEVPFVHEDGHEEHLDD